ncbi:hypothetical protein KJ359_002617 [Pestalotiopsis sp. 9143b]|nr:hypothetical protein KJ359_002617 [Pestalotiopsis sp. 9143b]
MSAMDQQVIQPPLDYSNNSAGRVVGVVILGFIATFVVGLRFWARRLTRQAIGPDDYLCAASLFFQHALMIASCVCIVQGGMGRDIRVTASEDPHSVVVLFQSLFVAEIAYTYSSPLIKLSALAFYWRVFPTRTVNIGCKILGSMCIAWCIAITILNFVQCRPLPAFWYVELQALPTTKCLDSILCFLANSISNCVIDFFTLTLPIHEVLKLKTSMRKKINICGVFLIGGGAFTSAVIRTAYTAVMYREGTWNFTLQFFPSGIATVVEIYVAIIAACAPTLMPVYRKLRFGDPIKSISTAQSKRTPASGVTTIGEASFHRNHFANSQGSFERLADIEDGFTPADHYGSRSINVSTGHSNRNLNRETSVGIPLEGIMMKRETVLSEV